MPWGHLLREGMKKAPAGASACLLFTIHLIVVAPAREFHPAVVIRVGKIEVELSNSVSAGLMRQLKGLVDFAE